MICNLQCSAACLISDQSESTPVSAPPFSNWFMRNRNNIHTWKWTSIMVGDSSTFAELRMWHCTDCLMQLGIDITDWCWVSSLFSTRNSRRDKPGEKSRDVFLDSLLGFWDAGWCRTAFLSSAEMRGSLCEAQSHDCDRFWATPRASKPGAVAVAAAVLETCTMYKPKKHD